MNQFQAELMNLIKKGNKEPCGIIYLLGFTSPNSEVMKKFQYVYAEMGSDCRGCVMTALACMADENELPKEMIVESIRQAIDKKTFRAAIEVAQLWKMDKALDEVANRLEDYRSEIRKSAIEAIPKFQSLSIRVLPKLEARLVQEKDSELISVLKQVILEIKQFKQKKNDE